MNMRTIGESQVLKEEIMGNIMRGGDNMKIEEILREEEIMKIVEDTDKGERHMTDLIMSKAFPKREEIMSKENQMSQTDRTVEKGNINLLEQILMGITENLTNTSREETVTTIMRESHMREENRSRMKEMVNIRNIQITKEIRRLILGNRFD